jgi:amino acid transporter
MPLDRLPSPEAGLVRALGVRTLAASIVNTTVGAGIFVLPAAVAANIGAAAAIAYLVCALAMGLIVTCFAMAGSRVSLTGGVYAYVEVAFGPFVGYLAGVLLYLACLVAVASVAAALASSVGVVIPSAGSGVGRAVFLVAVVGLVALLNRRGVKAGGRLVEVSTLLKLAPLVLFVAVGLMFVRPEAIAWPGLPRASTVGDSVLLLIFAFLGIEVALVPSGEVANPSRTIPRAVFLALGVTTLLYMAVQMVAQGVLGAELARAGDAPLAVAAQRFLGAAGRNLLLAGAAVSMFGYVSGDMLASPRMLFAFGRDHLLPRAVARVHPRYRTPTVAIALHAAIVAAVAASGSFDRLVLLSNVATLSLYLLCCAAAWQLARKDVRSGGPPFNVPGGAVVPALACGVIVWILSHATRAEFEVEGAVLAIAAILYALRRVRSRMAGPVPLVVDDARPVDGVGPKAT